MQMFLRCLKSVQPRNQVFIKYPRLLFKQKKMQEADQKELEKVTCQLSFAAAQVP